MTIDIKLIVSDVDGTVGIGGACVPEVRTFLENRWSPDFTLATGRAAGNLRSLELDRLCTQPMITECGGRIVNPTTGRTLAAFPVEEGLARFDAKIHGTDLLYACFAPGGNLPYTFFAPPGVNVPKRYAEGARVLRDLTSFLMAARAQRACKINFRLVDHTFQPDWEDVFWNEGSADLVARTANKGTAIKWLCQRLGLKLEEVMVIGNDHNDEPMFKLQGPTKIYVGQRLEAERLKAFNLHHTVSTPQALAILLERLFPQRC